MTDSKYLQQFARYAASFVLNFAHGSLLVVGIMVAVAASYQYAVHGVAGFDPRTWIDAEKSAASDLAEVSSGAELEAAPDVAKLPAEYSRLVQYIAKRHKVAGSGLEQLVRTAIHEGRLAHVDPVLILAVTSVESGFNPMAESGFGAQGLMQIIPRFHQDKIDAARGATALLEPAENIRVGARILRDYLRSAGALEPALQQYGGVSDANDMAYASKVMTELERFRQIMKFGAVRTELAENAAPASVRAPAAQQPVSANPG
jgi:soluble lytic murein transglycosylase-like protein